ARLDEDARGFGVVNDRLQRAGRTSLARRTRPAVGDHVRPPGGIGVLPAQVGRRDEELEALGIGGRTPGPLVHVAAPDPLRTRSDTDLVPGAVVADRRAGRVTPVTVVVARRDGVCSAAAAAAVDRVVPVVVVVDGGAVPAAVVA